MIPPHLLSNRIKSWQTAGERSFSEIMKRSACQKLTLPAEILPRRRFNTIKSLALQGIISYSILLKKVMNSG
jgi:hypothetical protein